VCEEWRSREEKKKEREEVKREKYLPTKLILVTRKNNI